MGSPLFQILRDRQLLGETELERWRQQAEKEDRHLDEILIRGEVFGRDEILRMLENHFFCPSKDLREIEYNPEVLMALPQRLAERHLAYPVAMDGENLTVVLADPENSRARDALAMMVNRAIVPMVALSHEIDQLVAESYERLVEEAKANETGSVTLPAKKNKSKGEPVEGKVANEIAGVRLNGTDAVEIVDEALRAASALKCTDVHFQPEEQDFQIRFRLDGILHTVARLSNDLAPPIISRIKILGKMDIGEKRVPQDGRHSLELNKQLLDLRISSLPSQFGEKIVIRILAKTTELLVVDNLKMPPAVRESFDEMTDTPLGFYIVTGPTGSGKTTTLYAALNTIDRKSVNVITLEDPIEYSMRGVTQVQIHEDVGLTFATGLRSILRQDPDVVLVGEIRDRETVEIACRASLTGHKVFSTIHTNDAVQAVTRLVDMGVQPYLITATLKGVLGQRLVRVNCESCKEEYAPNDTERAVLGYPKIDTLWRGAGCVQCAGTGYHGREAIFEYFSMNENMHKLVLDRASPFALRHLAQRNGMILMAEFAKRAVIEGRTTVAEIQRAILSEAGREQLCTNCQHVINIDFSVCPFCSNVLQESCTGCGSGIDSNWDACPSCGQQVEREWEKVFCRTCLAPVDPGWEQCRYCGSET